ncbi:transporter substrate-binding domain-containing protein [Muricoccus pecuniae]|uniref:Polar amino acid transport system substrate-binding protein n=1 Tax=Muricoccus pecuniae TaxID=693023 RepID=A0A840YFK4_9PROT|nr:transporter substrate-binding domain-containing protein [Roseomonas pecuniae]MBB5693262.1 polar amino acid transport system substrate-binding protein [Roseomonas pecuniae]
MSITRRGLGAATLGTGLAAAFIRRAAANNLEKAKRAGELVVATEMHFAPFDFTEGGRQSGLNAELFAEFAKDIGVKVTFQDLPWPAVLPGLEAGRYDLVGGPATITRARAERYRFSVPVAEATVALLKSARDTSITKPQDIAGRQLGCATATAQLAQFQAFVATLPGSTPPIREYQSFSEAYADLAAGRVVAVANSLPNIAYVAKQRPNVFSVVQPPFGAKSYFGYIGRKDADSAPLMDALDATIVKMRNDGRLAALQTKWFGQSFETPDTVPPPQV